MIDSYNNDIIKSKIGKMLIFGINASVQKNEEDILNALQKLQNNHIGSVILYANNISSPKGLKTIVEQIKSNNCNVKASSTINSTLEPTIKNFDSIGKSSDYPLIMVDQEGGKVLRLKKENGFDGYNSENYPSAYTIANNSDVISAINTYQSMAKELNKYDINVALGPILDLNLGNSVISGLERSYSHDPEKVAKYASIYMKSMEDNNVKTVCKHFPGHGSQGLNKEQDSHKGYVDLTDTFSMNELIPYYLLIKTQKFPFAIMTAHVVNRRLDESGLPATLSQKILGNLKNGEIFHSLQKEIQANVGEKENGIEITEIVENKKIVEESLIIPFKGPIISDDMMMLAIQKEYSLEEAVVKAINAGCDMLIFSNHSYCTSKEWGSVESIDVINIILNALEQGIISEERIDDAVSRIDSWIAV